MQKKEKKRRTGLKIWLIGLGVLILVAVLYGVAMGSRVEVKTTETIKAPREKVYARLSSFGPWKDRFSEALKKEDPTAVVTVSGPEQGEGGTISWTGDKLGQGRITIVRSEPETGVWYEGAIRSDEVNIRGSVTYEATADGTKVTADMEGDLPPVIGGFVRGYIEEQFREMVEQALADLKREVE